VSQYVLVGGADGIRVTGVAGRLPSAAQTADKWHVLDGCSNPPTRSVPQAGVVVQTWKSCIDGSSVAYTVVAGGLHNWPGGPTISTAPDPYSSRYDASDAIWNFLSAHRLSPTTVAGKLLSLTASVGRRGRAIVAKFRLGEPVRVVASLSGHGRPLRYRSMSLRAGASTRLQLGLPAKTAPGRYTLKLAMTDSYGRKLALSRSIAVPKPKH
jgi:hypothetical protein